jgi:DNA repair exonuclease SbcCD ATPase subunit
MQLISLNGENWGQHSQINITFEKSNWIKGGNDTGKTTIIRAIQFCLDTTSGAARSHGQGYALKEGTEKGWLELSFEFGNQIHTILKTFVAKGAATIKVDNKSMTLSDAAEVFRKLGMPPSTQLLGLSVLSQGEMHSIVSEKPAARMLRINELMGMEPVKTLRKQVKKQKDSLQTKKEGLLSGGIDETPKQEQLVEEERTIDLEKTVFQKMDKPEDLKLEELSHEYHNLEESKNTAEEATIASKKNIIEWAKPWAETVYQGEEAPSAQTLIDRAAENSRRSKSNLDRMKTITKFKLQERQCPYAKDIKTVDLQTWITQINAETKTLEGLNNTGISETEALTINLDKVHRAILLENQKYKDLEIAASKIHTAQDKDEIVIPLSVERNLESLWAEIENQKVLGNPWDIDPLTGDKIDPALIEKCKQEAQNREQKRSEQKETQDFLKQANEIEETKNKDVTTILEILKKWKEERASIKEEFKRNSLINAVNRFRNVNAQKDQVSTKVREVINIEKLEIYIEIKALFEKLPEALEVGKESFSSEEQKSALKIFESKNNTSKLKNETFKNTTKPEITYPKLEKAERITRIQNIEELKESYTEHRVSIKNRENNIEKLKKEIIQIKNRKTNVEELQNVINRLTDTYEFLDSKNGPQTVINSLFLQILENANNILNNVGANIELISDKDLNLYAGNPMKTDPDNYPPSSLLGFGKATLCGISLTLALREFYNDQNPGAPINLLITDEPSAFVEKHILPQLYKELNGGERDEKRMSIIVEHDPLVESVCQKIIEAPFFKNITPIQPSVKNIDSTPGEEPTNPSEKQVQDLLFNTIIDD